MARKLGLTANCNIFSLKKVSIDPFDTRWETHFERLQEFFRERGCFPYDIDPDKLDDDGRRLWDWTLRQKMHYRAYKNKDPSGTLTEERIAKMEGIGFSWSKRNDIWMQRYQELIDYKEHHGDTLVPSSYQANQSLATWTQEQRTQYRRWQLGKLTQEYPEYASLINLSDYPSFVKAGSHAV